MTPNFQIKFTGLKLTHWVMGLYLLMFFILMANSQLTFSQSCDPEINVLFSDSFSKIQDKDWCWSKNQKITGKFNNPSIESKAYGDWEAEFYRKQYNLWHGRYFSLRFQVNAPISRAHFMIENGTNGKADYRRFAAIAKYGKLIVEYNATGINGWVEDGIICKNFQLNRWYRLKVGIDDKQGFSMLVFDELKPEDKYFYRIPRFKSMEGLKWRFLHHIHAGSAFIDDYKEVKGFVKPVIKYHNETFPSDKPETYADWLIPSSINAVFSPDGREFYFSAKKIMVCKLREGTWSKPQEASFGGESIDVDPMFSVCGKRLYFISLRAIDKEGNLKPKGYQIWLCYRKKETWSEPIRLPEPINLMDYNQAYPSINSNGDLYFQSNHPNGLGKSDIYLSRYVDGKHQAPENIGVPINSPFAEGDVFIAPDSSYIIFASEGRPDSFGKGDLYISYKIGKEWSKPINLGPSINTKMYEYCPYVSPDGKYFFYTIYKKEEQKC